MCVRVQVGPGDCFSSAGAVLPVVVLPESRNGLFGECRVCKAVSEIVKEGELVLVHDIGFWMCLYS